MSAARAWLGRWGAVVVHPERHALRERTIGHLVLALMLSASAHLALLSTLDRLPRRYEGALRLTLQARLVPAELPAQLVPGPEIFAPPSWAPGPPLPQEEEPPRAAARPLEAPPQAEPGSPVVLPERYFLSREVDTPAVAVERPPLIYPEGPLIWRMRGTVRARVYIGADGSVESVALESARPEGFYFEDEALRALRKVRYSPAIKDGQAVRSQVIVEVTFDPYENVLK